ncbi:AAA family ATPase [Pyrobaculum islandicum]|uniref:AAA family ATPase n=1 Tax=Pyrobaculum islandicum TaxID=2277 RepID=UPI00069D6C1D|nr:AAA family ATPase [Pyrobaculum islandicum]
MKIHITNFKSIKELQIELGARVAVQCHDIHHYGNPNPTTVELAGEQESSAASPKSLQLVAECQSPTKAKITVVSYKVEIKAYNGELKKIKHKDREGEVNANFYVPRESPAVFPNAPRELQLLLSMLYAFAQQEPPYEVVRGGPADVMPRLYSFDRLGVAANIALGLTDATAPHYLDEWGRNLGRLLYREGKLAERINTMLSDLAGVEVRPLHNGRLAFFDGGREVGPSSVSDTVLRMLYLAAALLTAGEGDVIMLDDPEAHVYPRAFVYLPDLIKEASEKAHVLVATHSGPLAETLVEKAGAEVYYITRRGLETTAYRVDLEKAFEKYTTLDDLVYAHKVKEEELIKAGVLHATTTGSLAP